jgi:hypothetical protein
VQLAGDHLERNEPATRAVFHVQRSRVPLFVNLDAGFENLIVERYEQRLPGDIADEIGARLRRAAKGSRSKLAVGRAEKDYAHVLELDDVARRFLTHHLDGILVGEIIAAFDRVEGVRFPAIRLADRRVDAALRSARMAANRMNLRDDCHVGTGTRRFQRGTHARQPRAQD